MQKIIKLSAIDEEHWQKEISLLLDTVAANIQILYNKYNLKVSEITYDSTLDFGMRTKIKTTVINQESDDFSFNLTIDISNKGRAFLNPIEREFNAYIIFHVSNDIANEIYKCGLSSLINSISEDPNLNKKIEFIIQELEPKLDEYHSMFVALQDIFLI